MKKVNLDIRRLIEESGFPYWLVAEKLGVADTTFSKKLRHELPLEEKAKIRQIIHELAAN
ncbi:hypothetical protein CAFE_20510 [Caprobacter fermentans]|uniref:XRE family transcriptional regulator n=1 Tax=Caproicibacter fermentans TaxID=2576756 RepID=A0A6N8I0A5_9FIRM|nr:hypothetical protein [Caproicibacter fermentans]MVB11338.1 hypothetical protein [Caproicibacter fermentans]